METSVMADQMPKAACRRAADATANVPPGHQADIASSLVGVGMSK